MFGIFINNYEIPRISFTLIIVLRFTFILLGDPPFIFISEQKTSSNLLIHQKCVRHMLM